MRLKVLTPHGTAFEKDVEKVVFDAQDGSFGMKPKHIDFVSKLVPGIVTYVEKEEAYIAVDEGILIKKANQIYISVRDAIVGVDLENLKQAIEQRFQKDEREERRLKSVATKLESDFIKRFLELKKFA